MRRRGRIHLTVLNQVSVHDGVDEMVVHRVVDVGILVVVAPAPQTD